MSNKNGKYNWMDPKDTEVKTCSICEAEIYGMGNNPQPVILKGKKLEVADSCCDSCNDTVVIPLRINEIARTTGNRISKVIRTLKEVN